MITNQKKYKFRIRLVSKGQRHNRTGLRRTVFFHKKLELDWCKKDRGIIRLVSKGQYFFYKKCRIGEVSKKTET